ncbi:MAG: TetR family transcriptional regulator [Gemmatimonadetes bacterium]|nr:TetR family transcriptional regulator [Gemmatimonadota bacterium]
MTDPDTRPYRKQKRAEAEEKTRRRIVDAAVQLHGTVGPASTTITEVARVARVSRMTVYSHFATDVEMYKACSSHWAEQNPFPDPSAWTEDDPATRLESALTELYSWYGGKRAMLGNVMRDAPVVPALSEVMDSLWVSWIDAVVGALSAGWLTGDPEARGAALRLAVDFHSWRLLDASGLDAKRGAAVMTRMVCGLA